ncbi:MAG: hypothetical protein DRJ15_00425 [Bacteroidetes bacterium]|nr:MAG: hypothetical protein DRJ15_00425 [Bacteroidota bacterium]
MKKLIIILTVAFMTISTGLVAQNLNAAGKSYNKGIELAGGGDVMGAIESYKKCAEISGELGDVGEGLKVKAESQICNLYMKMGIEKFKVKKYDSAIILFTESDTYAKMINDPAIDGKLKSYFAASYTGKGNALFKKTKFQQAVDNYNQALTYNPEYANAHYGLVLGASKLDDVGLLEVSVKNVQDYSSDEKLKTKANIAAGKFFLRICGEAIKKEEYNIATMNAEKSIQYYKEDPNAFFYYAMACNGKEDWLNAQKAALKAISFEGEKSKGNYYFELARAYEGAGDKEKACEAYGNVKKGPNKDVADYQRNVVLKCN